MIEVPDKLSDAVAAFQRLQLESGAVPPSKSLQAESLLREIAQTASPLLEQTQGGDLRNAFEVDTEAWLAAGLHTVPAYDRMRDVLRAPSEGETVFFVGPVVMANGPMPRGHHFEFFLGRRHEPSEGAEVARLYPHPKNRCQSLRLLDASRGLASGNCIVFFPENIAASRPLREQKYAMFFFNKFRAIFRCQTLPVATGVFGRQGAFFDEPHWLSEQLDDDACYRARCLWGYLHDYFHHQGPRPFDEHVALKCNWFVGLLEELKVDCQSALACLDGAIPFGQEIFEFVMLERLFRYPLQVDATRNFDAGSGVLLFARLLEDRVLVRRSRGLSIDRERMSTSLQHLVEHILHLEANSDDAQYRSEALAFVRRYLPEGRPGERFRIPACYAEVLGDRISDRMVRAQ